MHTFFFDKSLFLTKNTKLHECSNFLDAVRTRCSLSSSELSKKLLVFTKNKHSFDINNIAAFEKDSRGNHLLDFKLYRRWDVISNLQIIGEDFQVDDLKKIRLPASLTCNRVELCNISQEMCILTMCTMFSDLNIRINLDLNLKPNLKSFHITFDGYLLDESMRNQWINSNVLCDGIYYSDGICQISANKFAKF